MLVMSVSTALALTPLTHEEASRISAKEAKHAKYLESIEACGRNIQANHAVIHVDQHKVDPHDLKAKIESFGRDDEIKYVYWTIAHGVAGRFTPETLDAMLDHEHVTSVDADCVIGVPDTETRTEQRVTTQQQSGATWGIDRIDEAAGYDGEYNAGTYTGSGALICTSAPETPSHPPAPRAARLRPSAPPPRMHAPRGPRPHRHMLSSVPLARTDILDTGVRADHDDFGGRVESQGWSAGTGSNCAPRTPPAAPPPPPHSPTRPFPRRRPTAQ